MSRNKENIYQDDDDDLETFRKRNEKSTYNHYFTI